MSNSLHLFIGPFKSWAVMKRRIKSAIIDVRWQESSILYQELHSILPPLFGCNVKWSPATSPFCSGINVDTTLKQFIHDSKVTTFSSEVGGVSPLLI
uniref:Uncharacterized protein n=1 Tax=Lotus japonicus TaxID=34305 RepID=I3SA73_LOTJA|nr:unknown [Lotus japonicus]